MEKVRVAGILLVLLVALAGCAGSASGQAANGVSTDRVDMPPSYRFDPGVIRVTAGTTVTWTNHDNFTHNVHVLGGPNWISQPVRPGESTSYKFDKPGTYPYLCDFHAQDMKGTVVVTAP